MRDVEVAPQLLEIWASTYFVYGMRKFWKAAQRAGINVSRDKVAMLMKVLEIEGVHPRNA